jgi:hypothetical protein
MTCSGRQETGNFRRSENHKYRLCALAEALHSLRQEHLEMQIKQALSSYRSDAAISRCLRRRRSARSASSMPSRHAW